MDEKTIKTTHWYNSSVDEILIPLHQFLEEKFEFQNRSSALELLARIFNWSGIKVRSQENEDLTEVKDEQLVHRKRVIQALRNRINRNRNKKISN